MPLTEDEIESGRNFHFYDPEQKNKCQNWRRSGKTKHWKRTPSRFEIPIKFGLYGHGYMTQLNVSLFHMADACPFEKAE